MTRGWLERCFPNLTVCANPQASSQNADSDSLGVKGSLRLCVPNPPGAMGGGERKLTARLMKELFRDMVIFDSMMVIT